MLYTDAWQDVPKGDIPPRANTVLRIGANASCVYGTALPSLQPSVVPVVGDVVVWVGLTGVMGVVGIVGVVGVVLSALSPPVVYMEGVSCVLTITHRVGRIVVPPVDMACIRENTGAFDEVGSCVA